MSNVEKTLYIPLYAKAYVSRRGIILNDPWAEKIWDREAFPLKGKAGSSWLALWLGMRAAVFDRWLKEEMISFPDSAVIHIGCGLDSRCKRVGTMGHMWFDVDFPQVICERQRFFEENDEYCMIAADVRQAEWIQKLPAASNAIAVMEGVSMYLSPEENIQLLQRLQERFEHLHVLIDCYSVFAAKASRYRNPINEVNVFDVYGIDDPQLMEKAGVKFVKEHSLTPDEMVRQLYGMEKKLFQTLYGGKIAQKMYRLYEYER